MWMEYFTYFVLAARVPCTRSSLAIEFADRSCERNSILELKTLYKFDVGK